MKTHDEDEDLTFWEKVGVIIAMIFIGIGVIATLYYVVDYFDSRGEKQDTIDSWKEAVDTDREYFAKYIEKLEEPEIERQKKKCEKYGGTPQVIWWSAINSKIRKWNIDCYIKSYESQNPL